MEYIFKQSKKKGQENMGNIYARIRVAGKDRKLGMDFCITKEEWQKYRSGQYSGKALMSSIGITYGRFADVLYEIKTRIENGYDPETTGNLIRSQVAMLLSGRTPEEVIASAKDNKKKERILLTTYIERYIRELVSGKRLKAGTTQRVSDDYANSFHGLLMDIKSFEKYRRRGRIKLDEFSKKLHDDLLAWYHENGILPNTIAGKFQRLHVVLSTAYEEKVTANMSFCHSDFIPKGQIVDHIYLKPEQIQQMLNIDISTPEKIRALVEQCHLTGEMAEKARVMMRGKQIYKIEPVRDIFIIGCLTGQRISDYARISDDMLTKLDSMDFIKLEQVKTGKKVIIPMDTRVAEILKKYNGCPPKITDDRMNHVLKLLGEMLGWTYVPKLDESRMGRKSGSRFCDMISTHTARRSFATNAFVAGIPLSSIMAVTGHSSERNLRRYLKMYIEEQAVIAYNDLKVILEYDEDESEGESNIGLSAEGRESITQHEGK